MVNGKVFVGAGDDGLYALNAKTGEPVWNYAKHHVDAAPTVVGNRVYCGSGVGDVFKETAIFALDVDSGKEVWRVATKLPVWGSPVADGGFVYFGNDYLTDVAQLPNIPAPGERSLWARVETRTPHPQYNPSLNYPDVAILHAAASDAYGNLVSAGSTITLALSSNPTGAILGGTTALTASNGLATFSAASVSKAGQGYTLVARAGAGTSAPSSAFTVYSTTHFGLIPSSAQAGTSFQVTVTALDATSTARPGAATTSVSHLTDDIP